MDSSVLIAFLDGEDAFHDAAVTALSELDDPPIVPTIAYAEVMVGVAAATPRARRQVESFFDTLRIEPLTRNIARRGADLRGRSGASLADALIIATAQEVDAPTVLTADGRWRRIDGRVRVIGAMPGS